MTIGEQIAQLRLKRGLSVRQLADLCGMDYSNLSKIERGTYNASIAVINKILTALDAQIKIVENMKYRIYSSTNTYIANTDPRFSGSTKIVIAEDLTLDEAKKQLLEIYENMNINEDEWPLYDDNMKFEYDSRYFGIEEQEEILCYEVKSGDDTIFVGRLKGAVETILEEESTEDIKLYSNDKLIWDGETDTIEKLKSL